MRVKIVTDCLLDATANGEPTIAPQQGYNKLCCNNVSFFQIRLLDQARSNGHEETESTYEFSCWPPHCVRGGAVADP